MKDRQDVHPPTTELPHAHTGMSEKTDKPGLDTADHLKGAPNLQTASTGDDAQSSMARKDYKAQLRLLQMELVKLQRHFIACGDRILVILEGRDAAGKDGSIKRIVEHLSPRETRVVALGKPSNRDRSGWYFQRFVPHLPVAEELVLFNRSWYNRAGVEHVMGFCTQAEHEEFMTSVPKFEELLVHSGIKLLKYYLDISKKEQATRLADRASDPLKQWKISPIDAGAIKLWQAYSDARDEMLLRTHTAIAPWHLVRTDNKRLARLNLMRDMLSRLHYAGKNLKLVQPDTQIVFEYSADCIEGKGLAN
jgi:polyphosphate kinase 2